jgi:hypothetical protein
MVADQPACCFPAPVYFPHASELKVDVETIYFAFEAVSAPFGFCRHE